MNDQGDLVDVDDDYYDQEDYGDYDDEYEEESDGEFERLTG